LRPRSLPALAVLDTSTSMSTEEERIRLDKWLWAARFFKTRSIAARAVDSGKVLVNGARVKPARALKVGDELGVRTPSAEFTVIVEQLSIRRGAATTAAQLFAETEQSRRRREEAKQTRVDSHSDTHTRGRPTKRVRRMIHRLRGEPL
jgi:ribosome-associated heat shock protein Hsp15